MGSKHKRLDREDRRRQRKLRNEPGRVPCGCYFCFPETIDRQEEAAKLREVEVETAPEEE